MGLVNVFLYAYYGALTLYELTLWIASAIWTLMTVGLRYLIPVDALIDFARSLWAFLSASLFDLVLSALPAPVLAYFESADAVWYGNFIKTSFGVGYQVMSLVVDPRIVFAMFTALVGALFVALFIRLARLIETAIWGST